LGVYTLLLILGHFLADFPLQFECINKKKSKTGKEGMYGLLIHTGFHFGVYLLFSLIYLFITNSWSYWFPLTMIVVIVSILHFFIDLLKKTLDTISQKSSLSMYRKSQLDVLIYLADQVIHMVAITVAVTLLTTENLNIIQHLIEFITLDEKLSLTLPGSIILSLIIILCNTYVSGYLISKILLPFRPNNSYTESRKEKKVTTTNMGNQNSHDDVKIETQSIEAVIQIHDSPKNAGVLIGFSERLIIMVLIMFNSIGSIGFIIAMKALTRFKQFEDKSFAEYYLIGSLVSILIGIVSGYMMLSIWN